MDSNEKKKLAVVAGKRMAEEDDPSDASMDDLCRKKFKPIAPKPVIRQDQHQAVLSTSLPLKKDSSQKKEHVVLPSPKFDPSNAFVMRPGSSLPFMCGGPMIMPIPVPVVPGKDGSYVPLQVPVPIPVMVPVVVSLNQATSPSASTPVTVVSDSKRNSSWSGEENSSNSNSTKKDKSNKKGQSKPEKSASSGDGADSKGAKVKPCRYKYSMIKNESLFRDILRNAGGDFMASHGITLSIPVRDHLSANNTSNEVSDTVKDKQDLDDRNNKQSDDNPIQKQSESNKQRDDDNVATRKELSNSYAMNEESLMRSVTINETRPLSEKNDTDTTNSQPVPPIMSNTSDTSEVLVMKPSSAVRERQDQQSCSAYLAMVTTASQTLITCTASSTKSHLSSSNLGTGVSQQFSYQQNQAPDALSTSGSTRSVKDNTQIQQSPSSSACTLSNAGTSVKAFSLFTSSTQQNTLPSSLNRISTNTSHIPASSSSMVTSSNFTGLQTNCLQSTVQMTESVRNSQWNFTGGSLQPSGGSEQPNRPAPRPFHNLAQRIAAVQSAEHDHPDDSNFYSMDELHSFSVEMDQSAGSLPVLNSDDTVNAVLGMADVSGPGAVGTAVSDSPTRRAVTAIVTPLPRSIPLASSTATITTVASQVSETSHNPSQETSQNPSVSLPPSRSSDQVMHGISAPQTDPGGQFLSSVTSSAQTLHQWGSGSSQSTRHSSVNVASVQNNSSIRPANTESISHGSQPNVSANHVVPITNQQRNVHMDSLQNRTCTAGVSSIPLSEGHVSMAQSYLQSPHPASQTSAYSTTPQASNSFISPNQNSNQPCLPTAGFVNNSDRTNVNFTSQSRNRNSLQSGQSLVGNRAESARSGYPVEVQRQNKQLSFPPANDNETSNTRTVHSSRQGEGQRKQMLSSSVPSAPANQSNNRPPHPPQGSVASNTQPLSSGFSSRSFFTPARLQEPATCQSHSSSAGVTATTSSGMNSSMNTMWQPPFLGNAPVSQNRPSFSSSVGGRQGSGSSSVARHSVRTDQPLPSARTESTRTVTASSSIQSVPLQSNLQTTSGFGEDFPPSNPARNHVGISDARVGTANLPQVPVSDQPPMYAANSQGQSAPRKTNPSGFNIPTSEFGTRMPYPLVPPIVFGNSAPARGIPMGGIHSVPLPGMSEQNVQPSPIVSSSPSTVHRPITPVMHDRHRMYLPSHYSTLHRPLYMPPSPAPSTDLSLLSPHSYGQLHVHDSVLYSPRYPSSIHSLSPGINTNFHTSSLHRSFSASDHQEAFSRNNLNHTAPHYEGAVPPMPIRMPQVGQSTGGTTEAASSHAVKIPPSITSLQHSSIIANRKQNSLFEQHLKELLERSARRHSAALASTHDYPSSVPHEHVFPHRTMGSFSSLPLAPSHSVCSMSFSSTSMPGLVQSNQPQTVSRLPSQQMASRHSTTSSASATTTAISTSATTLSTIVTPTTSTIVTSRAILGNTSDKYLPVELLSPDSGNSQTAPSSSVSTTPSQVAGDQVVKCGDTVLQCSRQVLRESGRTVLCCWYCDYHTAEPRKMKRHQKKESEPMKCQLCSFQSESRCSVNQHYKQEHLDKDDPFRSVPH